MIDTNLTLQRNGYIIGTFAKMSQENPLSIPVMHLAVYDARDVDNVIKVARLIGYVPIILDQTSPDIQDHLAEALDNGAGTVPRIFLVVNASDENEGSKDLLIQILKEIDDKAEHHEAIIVCAKHDEQVLPTVSLALQRVDIHVCDFPV